jgi:indolepyruvate ferredoxin oxidoreductase alpha subunit
VFIEEVDAFVEDQVKIIYAEHQSELGPIAFYGKNTGEVSGPQGPAVGEMDTDIVMDALARILEIDRASVKAGSRTPVRPELLVPRELAFCSGCPHRAAFFAIKTALTLDGRNGFVVGDIGCYGLAAGATGYHQIKALHCMGSGMGNVSGFDKLKKFGFDQPAVAVVGDSTFYHAGMPALVNAVANETDSLFIVLDNSVTAMTGFQINPASPFTGTGEEKLPLKIEDITRGMHVPTSVLDPIADLHSVIDTICRHLREPGVNVIVLRRICATYSLKAFPAESPSVAAVDAGKCIGDDCGCNRFCNRVVSCPALQFDDRNYSAYVLEETCTGCNLCVQLCPEGAIVLKEMIPGEN